MRRTRNRDGGGRRSAVVLAVAVTVGSLAAFGVVPSVAFDTASVPRPGSVDVAPDESGALGLDVAANVSVNETDPLVNVTNSLGRTVTVTVGLRNDSTNLGDLVVDGTSTGDTAEVTLSPGATETVSIAVPDDGSLAGEVVYFDVTVTEPQLEITAPDRQSEVTS